jgi:putative aldouronate transport system permease protein
VVTTVETSAGPLPARTGSLLRETRGYKVFRAFNVVALLGVVAVTLYPFLMIIARSFSSDTAIRSGSTSRRTSS